MALSAEFGNGMQWAKIRVYDINSSDQRVCVRLMSSGKPSRRAVASQGSGGINPPRASHSAAETIAPVSEHAPVI
jgi:hypothetical protein